MTDTSTSGNREAAKYRTQLRESQAQKAEVEAKLKRAEAKERKINEEVRKTVEVAEQLTKRVEGFSAQRAKSRQEEEAKRAEVEHGRRLVDGLKARTGGNVAAAGAILDHVIAKGQKLWHAKNGADILDEEVLETTVNELHDALSLARLGRARYDRAKTALFATQETNRRSAGGTTSGPANVPSEKSELAWQQALRAAAPLEDAGQAWPPRAR